MFNEKLLDNYKKSLQQKYNAVCMDVDGTLTEHNSTKIDKKVLFLIAEILKRGIPLVFITGRGETGLKDLKNDVVEYLKNECFVTHEQLSKMYALTNDGARLFFTSDNSIDLFNENEYISSLEDLKLLKEFDIFLLSSGILENYKISYSVDSKTNFIINIRIELPLDNSAESITKKISDLVNTGRFRKLNITLGKHQGNQILQIGTAIKAQAIEKVEKIIGIPQNSMLRIGDCGDALGNDFSMLDCNQGFSVGSTSGKNDCCFPVIVDGKILKGVTATIWLLSNAKLLPTICLEHADLNNYTKEYSKIEKKLHYEKNKKIIYFDNLINDKFGSIDGVNFLYDSSSGSIKIPMYDWFSMSDTPLKSFWQRQKNGFNQYILYDNESVLLRGSSTYYYFLAKRVHNGETRADFTSKNMVITWLENYIDFFNLSKVSLNETQDFEDLNNVKMVLGILDNIRNNLLVLLNYLINKSAANDNLIINLESVEKTNLISYIYRSLIDVERYMQKLSFLKEGTILKEEMLSLIENVSLINQIFKTMFSKEQENYNYSKEFRAYREIDNFAENFITAYLSLQDNVAFSEENICGLSYGGIELPIIMKSINDLIENVVVLKFNQNVTGYSKKQSLMMRFFNIDEHGNVKQSGIDSSKKFVLMDDNLLTGKTMQLAITTLYDLNLSIDKIIVVRYPGVNRINQMFLSNHGAIDYKRFFNLIQGLYFSSPYSWRDPFSSDKYEDSLGIFDLNRRKILECLVKNGDFDNNSEVMCLKRKVKNEGN